MGHLNKNATLISLLFLMLLMQLSTDIYLPSVLVLARELNTSIACVQMTFFAFLAAAGFSQLIYGPLVDRFGRKYLLMFGACVFLITSVVAALAHSVAILITARAFQGLGAGVFSVGSRAMMRDILDHEGFKKIAIYQGMTWSFVPVLAPVIGSYIQHYLGWRYNFGFLALAGVIAVILTSLLRETLAKRASSIHPMEMLKSYVWVLRHPHFWPFMVGMAADAILLTAFFIFAPILLQGNLGVSVIQYGWLIFIIALAALFATVTNRIFIKFINGQTMIKVSMWLCFLSGVLFLLGCALGTHLVVWFVVTMMLFQLGGSWLFPYCVSYAMRPMQHQAGKAAAVIGFNNLISSAFAALLLAYGVRHSEWLFGLIFVVFSSIALVVFYRICWPKD